MHRRLVLSVVAVALFPFLVHGAERPTYLLITAPAYRTACEPLRQHRLAQGFDVHVLQTTDVLTAKEIVRGEAQKLRGHAHEWTRQKSGPVYVLLVGAVEPAGFPEADRRTLPPLKGEVSRMKGQPTDHGYGDAGADHVCRLAVGRLPARDVDEAHAMVRKIIAFEQDTRPGEWRRRLTVLAGVPEFNPLVDALVERLALAKLEHIDSAWHGQAVYHNAASRFCLPDALLHRHALERVQAGQAMTLYLGHSGPQGFWAGGNRFLDRDDWAKLKIPTGPGLFATFGCLGCQLQGRDGEGYGVAAMRNPHGPVAVIGSHGICFAAMVQLAAEGLFESMLARQQPERLGDVWLGVQRHLAKGPLNPLLFRMLDAVDGDATIAEAVQRREHLEMFLLLGDPAMKLPMLASDLRLEATGEIGPGKTLRVRVRAPARLEGAKVKLSLERPLTSLPVDLAPLPRQPGPERERIMLANYQRANQFVLDERPGVINNGHCDIEVRLPAALTWNRMMLRAYAATDQQEAMGTQVLDLAKNRLDARPILDARQMAPL